MKPEKFEAAMREQDVQEIDWNNAMDIVRILSEIHSKETDVPSDQIQLVVAMEELAELSQEISKMIRRRGNRTSVLEELADVCIMCKYIQSAINASDDELNRAINVKLGRYSLALPNTEMR